MISQKDWIVYIVIVLLVGTTVFFATRNYRNEIVLAQLEQINKQQQIINQTTRLLNLVNWDEGAIKTWQQLGYVIEPKLSKQN